MRKGVALKTVLIIVLVIGGLSVVAGIIGVLLQKRAGTKPASPAPKVDRKTEEAKPEVYASDRVPSDEVVHYLTVLKNTCRGSSPAFRESQALLKATPFQASVAWTTALVDGTEVADTGAEVTP